MQRLTPQARWVIGAFAVLVILIAVWALWGYYRQRAAPPEPPHEVGPPAVGVPQQPPAPPHSH